ncbi:MAG TPA: hypothetical protein VNJ70_03400 [Thermoanaerobaculia bacterium]|nr:hypothetical protein [Thermoanaerobaculia bacterium]
MNGIKRCGAVRWLATVALLLASTAAAMAQGEGPYQFYAVSPCRVADTRNTPNGLNAGPVIFDYSPRQFKVQGNCGIPVGAKAATLNITVVAPTAAGWLAISPSNVWFSGFSTINFNTGESVIANGAIVPLSSNNADLHIIWGDTETPNISNNNTAHVVLDVTGYFE